MATTSNNLPAETNEVKDDTAEPTAARWRYRWLKSICMLQLWICLGLDGGMLGPSLMDLTRVVGCNYEELTRALATKSVGIIVGSVLAGILADRFQRHIDLLLALQLLLLASSTAALPWAPNLWVIATAFLGQGLSHGAISATGNSLLLKMWGDNAASPLHLLHMGYGVGTMVAPLIVQPFLSRDGAEPIRNVTWTPSAPDAMQEMKWNGTMIYVPYAISGGLGLFPVLFFLIFYCLPYPSFMTARIQRKTIRQILSPGECFGGQTIFGIFMFVIIFLLYTAICGKDVSIGTFLFTIAVESKLHFSKHAAAILNTVFFAAYTAGRLAASVVTRFLPIEVVLFFEILGNLAAVLGMAIWGLNSTVFLWIFATLFGFFAGPIYPGGLAWMNKYMDVSAVAIAVLDLGVGVGALVFPWASGYLYQHKHARDVIYLSLGANVFLLLILIMAQIIVCIRGDTSQINVGTGQGDEGNREEEDEEERVNERTPLVN